MGSLVKMFNDKGLDIFFIGVFLVVGGLGVFGILETEKKLF